MAKIRNISGDDRTVPGLGSRLVLAGALVSDVPYEEVYSYTSQGSVWLPVDEEAQRAHDEATAPDDEAQSAEDEVSE